MEQLLQQMGGMNGLGAGGFDAGPKALVEFKAGKMNYDGRMCTPDRRKGIVRVVEDQGGMKQFQWCDADTKNPIDSFYVFPDDAKFEKVKKNRDRVYILEMKHTQQRYFYWMQDEEKEKDKSNALKVHNVLNNIEVEKKEEDKPMVVTGPEMSKQ